MTITFPPACLTETVVRAIFRPMEQNDASAFLSNLAENLSLTAMGLHNPIRGEYLCKADITTKAFGRIMPKMDTDKPLGATVQKVIVAGDWAIVELKGHGMTKGGLGYDHELCWICRFEEGLIVEARVYMDSALLEKVLAE